MTKISRIVLAAGAGSRIGKTKALLELGDKTALERVTSLRFDDQAIETFVVCGAESEKTSSLATSLGATPILNPAWESGQTGSLKKALSVCDNAEYFLLHPVDLPLISQADYNALAKAFSSDPGHQLYVLSVDKRRGHPLIFSRKFSDLIQHLGDDEPLRRLTRAEQDIVYVNVENPWIRRDIDYPEDLEEARAYLDSPPSGSSTSP